MYVAPDAGPHGHLSPHQRPAPDAGLTGRARADRSC